MNNQLKFLLTVLLLGLSVAAESHAQLEVRIPQRIVKAYEQTVQIGQIAEISGVDQRQANAIRKINVDSFRSSQSELAISKHQIAIRIMLAGYQIDANEISGPDNLTVHRVARSDLRTIIETQVRRELSQAYSIPESEIQVSMDAKFKKPPSIIDLSSLSLSLPVKAEIPLGKQSILAHTKDSQTRSKSFRFDVSIALYRELACATEDIPSGTLLTSRHLKTVRRPVTTRDATYVSIPHAIGKTNSADINKYSLINTKSLRTQRGKQKFLVAKNSLVNAKLRRRTLNVTLKDVKTLTGGNLGDRIQLLNPNTNQRMSGRVVDAQTVQLY